MRVAYGAILVFGLQERNGEALTRYSANSILLWVIECFQGDGQTVCGCGRGERWRELGWLAGGCPGVSVRITVQLWYALFLSSGRLRVVKTRTGERPASSSAELIW